MLRCGKIFEARSFLSSFVDQRPESNTRFFHSGLNVTLQRRLSPQAEKKEKKLGRSGGAVAPPVSGRIRDGYGSHSSKSPSAKSC